MLLFGLYLGDGWVCGPCYATLDAEAQAERTAVGMADVAVRDAEPLTLWDEAI